MRICIKIFFLMLLPAFIFLTGCSSSSSKNSSNAEIIVPSVSSTNPANKATNVAINGKITATFSEEMDPATITTATFYLKLGTTLIPSTVTFVGNVAILSPASNLAISSTYTATITTDAKDMAGTPLAVDKTWSFTTGTTTDTTAPTVSFTIPNNADTAVLVNRNISATFSEGMDPATITAATFNLLKGINSVAGTVTCVGTVATFRPASDLEDNSVYTAKITKGAKDLAGNSLAVTMSWSFITETSRDTIAPRVISTIPVIDGTDVPVNSSITATFSEGMYALTITTATFKLMQGTTPVAGDVTFQGHIATFKPASNLQASTIYTATITTGAHDLADNELAADYKWSFTTGGSGDTTAPTIIATLPVDGATGVVINRALSVTFSEGMDPTTITTATFTLMQGVTPVVGTVTYAGTVATFKPILNLVANTPYTATITTGAKDLADNALAADKTWSFTTEEALAKGPAPVNLGTAGDFAVLAKAGVTGVPICAITGDVGVSPITSSAITGFTLILDGAGKFSTSSQITGKVYAADYMDPTPSMLTTAVINMETAYTDAAARVTPDFVNLGAGDISGLTLIPGLYKWGTGVLISTDVTLNGGPDDVWIFQISGGLIAALNVKVTLAGDAKAKNVFWQTEDAVLIHAGAQFVGIILSKAAITLDTGAEVTGRLLSQTAVTLGSSTVTQPDQAISIP